MAKAKKAKTAKRTSAKSAKPAGGAKSNSANTAKSAKTGGGRRPNPAFMAALTPSPALAEVVGADPLPRTEVTKKLWAYIKQNDLQDQKNRRMIKADDTLKPVFGGKNTVNMFEMTKLVNKHLK